MISQEESNEKVSDGWLRVWFAFEALALGEEVAKKAMVESDAIPDIADNGAEKIGLALEKNQTLTTLNLSNYFSI